MVLFALCYTSAMHNQYFEAWLTKRGVSTDTIALFNITSYEHPTIGECIRIPITDSWAKYRRDPREDIKPKYLYDTGSKITLYGADKLKSQGVVVVTEGELDALVLWSQNIQAVSSTGGALTFQPEWVDVLAPHDDIHICFDNDNAGAEGMVKVLTYLPQAKVILVPEQVGVKDISDYVAKGGDFRALMATAKHYASVTEVEDDKHLRDAVGLSTRFHDAYLDYHRRIAQRTPSQYNYRGDDAVLKAKTYPLSNFIEFTRYKACCPFHNEKTPSLHYYSKTNTAHCFGACGKTYDAIDFYRAAHNCSFKKAVEELNKLV